MNDGCVVIHPMHCEGESEPRGAMRARQRGLEPLQRRHIAGQSCSTVAAPERPKEWRNAHHHQCGRRRLRVRDDSMASMRRDVSQDLQRHQRIMRDRLADAIRIQRRPRWCEVLRWHRQWPSAPESRQRGSGRSKLPDGASPGSSEARQCGRGAVHLLSPPRRRVLGYRRSGSYVELGRRGRRVSDPGNGGRRGGQGGRPGRRLQFRQPPHARSGAVCLRALRSAIDGPSPSPCARSIST